MIIGVQNSMFWVLGDTKLTGNETFTMLAEISSLLNKHQKF